MQASCSDFPAAPRPARAPWGPGAGVVGALSATFALGFTEGCLEIERRPIPLRFALRFAAANLLPSAVWSSVSARDVAAASGVAPSALVGDVSSSSTNVGKRLVLVKSVRALRMAAGSYGLVWSLWRWRTAVDDNNNESDRDTAYGESVVRLAPVNSPLSRASRRKHGEHIVTVPVTESWKKRSASKVVDAVDWEKVGVQIEVEEGGQERVKMLEVELGDAQAATYAGKLKANAVRAGHALCSVAVAPPSGQPLPTKIFEAFDVCFNPMSAVLAFIASVCRGRGVAHVILVVNREDESASADADTEEQTSSRSHLSTSQMVAGLLYRHGITTTVLKTPPRDLVDEQKKDEPAVDDSGLVFFISESLAAGQLAAKAMTEQGFTTQADAYFIVEESLCGQIALREELQAHSVLLETTASMDIEERDTIDGEDEQEQGAEPAPEAKYLSVADVSDQTLQGIRKLVRQGKKPDTIQAAVYQAYGPQRVVAPARHDQFSNVHV